MFMETTDSPRRQKIWCIDNMVFSIKTKYNNKVIIFLSLLIQDIFPYFFVWNLFLYIHSDVNHIVLCVIFLPFSEISGTFVKLFLYISLFFRSIRWKRAKNISPFFSIWNGRDSNLSNCGRAAGLHSLSLIIKKRPTVLGFSNLIQSSSQDGYVV